MVEFIAISYFLVVIHDLGLILQKSYVSCQVSFESPFPEISFLFCSCSSAILHCVWVATVVLVTVLVAIEVEL